MGKRKSTIMNPKLFTDSDSVFVKFSRCIDGKILKDQDLYNIVLNVE